MQICIDCGKGFVPHLHYTRIMVRLTESEICAKILSNSVQSLKQNSEFIGVFASLKIPK